MQPKRKYLTREAIFQALRKKLDNLTTDISIVPRDGSLVTQRQLIISRIRDILLEVEDPSGLYESNPTYEEL